MAFDLYNYSWSFDLNREKFLLSNSIEHFNNVWECAFDPISGIIGKTDDIKKTAEIIKPFSDLLLDLWEKKALMKRCFPQLYDVVCDPGYAHPEFNNDVHPGNKEAVFRLVNKWLIWLGGKSIDKFSKKIIKPWIELEVLDKKECKLTNEKLSRNLLAIGSPRSTFTTGMALGYSNGAETHLLDKYRGLLRWEFHIDYQKEVLINQKIEHWEKGKVLTHKTKHPYYFFDTTTTRDSKLDVQVNNGVPKDEWAVITKIPNKLCKSSACENTSVTIFEGLHSVGTKSVEALIGRHIKEIDREFTSKDIDPARDSYQILFGFQIEPFKDDAKKAFQPIIKTSKKPIIEKLEPKNIERLPNFVEN